jgi:hypothetical protein
VRCDSCDRTLLMGESAAVFHDRSHRRAVCALCETDALARGWLRDGAAAPPPPLPVDRPGLLTRLRQRERPPVAPPERTAVEPPRASVVRIASTERPHRERVRTLETERAAAAVLAVAAGLEAFNASPYRRTIVGIARTLGRPKVSVIALTGVHPDVVVTIAWDISWYRYRVDPQLDPPVRLEGRGDDVGELDARWRSWNASLDEDGTVAVRPAIA